MIINVEGQKFWLGPTDEQLYTEDNTINLARHSSELESVRHSIILNYVIKALKGFAL